MSKKAKFLSNIIGYVIPQGSHHDPVGKEGLSMFVSDSYRYGIEGYKDINGFFFKLEKTGAFFTTHTGYENTYLFLSVPRENRDKAEVLLEEIVEKVLTTEIEFEKIKKRRLSVIDDVNSDDRSRAYYEFSSMVLKERKKIGEVESLKNVNLKDVKEQQDAARNNKYFFSISEPEALDLDQVYEIKNFDGENYDAGVQKHNLLNRDIEQKVIYMGYETKGLIHIDPEVLNVADAVMYSGLSGLVPEVIRMQNSAAYYAFYKHDLMTTKGAAMMSAGVSEKNVPKVVDLMYQLFYRGAEGDFSDQRLDDAKKYYLGRLDRAYDSIEALAFRDLSRKLNGLPLYSYEEEVEKINNVTKDQVQDYFRAYLEVGSPYLVVNGKLSNKVKDKVIKQFKGYDRS